jgi:hypothetical protein
MDIEVVTNLSSGKFQENPLARIQLLTICYCRAIHELMLCSSDVT